MVRAGCIVFVPDGGGQVEVIGGEAQLRDASRDDAVAKIACTLDDAALQERLRAHLAGRADALSTEHFARRLLDLVCRFAAARDWDAACVE